MRDDHQEGSDSNQAGSPTLPVARNAPKQRVTASGSNPGTLALLNLLIHKIAVRYRVTGGDRRSSVRAIGSPYA
jgi:hypothetical protein